MKKKLLVLLISLTTVTSVGVTAYYNTILSRIPPPPPCPNPPNCDPGAVVPIDGGISILVLTGFALGANRLRNRKRKQDATIDQPDQ